jgi:hypothetical protein
MNERFAERQKTVNLKKQMKRERLAERLKTVKQEDNLSPILSTALINL